MGELSCFCDRSYCVLCCYIAPWCRLSRALQRKPRTRPPPTFARASRSRHYRLLSVRKISGSALHNQPFTPHQFASLKFPRHRTSNGRNDRGLTDRRVFSRKRRYILGREHQKSSLSVAPPYLSSRLFLLRFLEHTSLCVESRWECLLLTASDAKGCSSKEISYRPRHDQTSLSSFYTVDVRSCPVEVAHSSPLSI